MRGGKAIEAQITDGSAAARHAPVPTGRVDRERAHVAGSRLEVLELRPAPARRCAVPTEQGRRSTRGEAHFEGIKRRGQPAPGCLHNRLLAGPGVEEGRIAHDVWQAGQRRHFGAGEIAFREPLEFRIGAHALDVTPTALPLATAISASASEWDVLNSRGARP